MRAGPWIFGARRGRVREAVGDRMHQSRVPARARPRPGVRTVPLGIMTLPMNLDDIAGVAHKPDGTPSGVVVLTHGAGGSRESPLLKRLCDKWARRGGV